MLSYQHSFHAGNHADVLKHLTLIAVLQKLNIKTKPYFYLDTHAGSGVYNLDSSEAKLNCEAETGVFQLSNATDTTAVSNKHATLTKYLEIVNDYAVLNRYPGSPLVASALLREQDNAFAAELHPQAFEALKEHCWRTQIKAQHRDGFAMLKAVLPPTPNRGAVLIDPAYESREEYQQVVDALDEAIKRWPIGIYMIWYPLLSETRVDRKSNEIVTNPKASLTQKMLTQLSLLPVKSVLNVQLCASTPSKEIGMYGSGMCILNPPWQLETELRDILASIESKLVSDGNQLSKVEWLKEE